MALRPGQSNSSASASQAKSLLEDAKTEAREDVHKAITDLHAADTTLQLAKEQLTAADAEYAQVFELYRAQESRNWSPYAQ